ncbi:hypothetical protein GIB67_042470 [Kingdonia uniflora]|uniref:RBR-type E3 ubiquitin transferase n=1 Tax=Kingdonia uniflora TaxID=39325 RepID=A0A7J7M0V3_9MAGN|nr:hypothetical protein GIB67_042470 [Kingdonia uniflora]
MSVLFSSLCRALQLLVLQAIYGNNIKVLSEEGGLRSFQIHIYIETPDEITVSAKLHSSNDNAKFVGKSDVSVEKVGASNELFYTFKVHYLPPITLTCLLPKSYPSHLPPCFTVSIQWLGILSISSLCHMLDLIWMDQPGQEIVYQWVEWLQSSSLSYIGIDNEIILGSYGMPPYTGDRRAFSGITSPDSDVPFLMNYNDDKCRKIFSEILHECCICFSEYAGTQFIRLPCQHFFCSKCMESYASIHVKEGTINKLLCPDVKCGGLVPPNVLKRLLDNEDFERWETLMLQKTLESMSDVVYCPKCETVCLEDEDHHAQCSKCFFSFCTLCMDRRHVGITCMTPETKLQILQERQGSSQLKAEQRRREKEMINDILSVKEVLRDAKQCPSCKMAISRIEGCNKMVCNNCGQFFCYRCCKAIDGYDHFSDEGCELFPRAMVQAWEERINERQILGQVQVGLYADQVHTCPLCRQLNAKVRR